MPPGQTAEFCQPPWTDFGFVRSPGELRELFRSKEAPMYLPTQLRQGVLGLSPGHLTVRVVFAMLAMLALASCEQNSTAPTSAPTPSAHETVSMTDPGDAA